MDLYRHGIAGKLAEYATNEYQSHRRIPEDAWDELIRSTLLTRDSKNVSALYK